MRAFMISCYTCFLASTTEITLIVHVLASKDKGLYSYNLYLIDNRCIYISKPSKLVPIIHYSRLNKIYMWRVLLTRWEIFWNHIICYNGFPIRRGESERKWRLERWINVYFPNRTPYVIHGNKIFCTAFGYLHIFETTIPFCVLYCYRKPPWIASFANFECYICTSITTWHPITTNKLNIVLI